MPHVVCLRNGDQSWGGRFAARLTVGALFLLAMWFAPLASIVPPQATAPALIIVGFHMMAVAREIPWDDYEDAIPAFVTMLVMPFTWSITNGISAGFVTYGVIKVFNGKAGELPATLWLVWSAFVLYFALPLIERAVQ